MSDFSIQANGRYNKFDFARDGTDQGIITINDVRSILANERYDQLKGLLRQFETDQALTPVQKENLYMIVADSISTKYFADNKEASQNEIIKLLNASEFMDFNSIINICKLHSAEQTPQIRSRLERTVAQVNPEALQSIVDMGGEANPISVYCQQVLNGEDVSVFEESEPESQPVVINQELTENYQNLEISLIEFIRGSKTQEEMESVLEAFTRIFQNADKQALITITNSWNLDENIEFGSIPSLLKDNFPFVEFNPTAETFSINESVVEELRTQVLFSSFQDLQQQYFNEEMSLQDLVNSTAFLTQLAEGIDLSQEFSVEAENSTETTKITLEEILQSGSGIKLNETATGFELNTELLTEMFSQVFDNFSLPFKNYGTPNVLKEGLENTYGDEINYLNYLVENDPEQLSVFLEKNDVSKLLSIDNESNHYTINPLLLSEYQLLLSLNSKINDYYAATREQPLNWDKMDSSVEQLNNYYLELGETNIFDLEIENNVQPNLDTYLRRLNFYVNSNIEDKPIDTYILMSNTLGELVNDGKYAEFTYYYNQFCENSMENDDILKEVYQQGGFDALTLFREYINQIFQRDSLTSPLMGVSERFYEVFKDEYEFYMNPVIYMEKVSLIKDGKHDQFIEEFPGYIDQWIAALVTEDEREFETVKAGFKNLVFEMLQSHKIVESCKDDLKRFYDAYLTRVPYTPSYDIIMVAFELILPLIDADYDKFEASFDQYNMDLLRNSALYVPNNEDRPEILSGLFILLQFVASYDQVLDKYKQSFTDLYKYMKTDMDEMHFDILEKKYLEYGKDYRFTRDEGIINTIKLADIVNTGLVELNSESLILDDDSYSLFTRVLPEDKYEYLRYGKKLFSLIYNTRVLRLVDGANTQQLIEIVEQFTEDEGLTVYEKNRLLETIQNYQLLDVFGAEIGSNQALSSGAINYDSLTIDPRFIPERKQDEKGNYYWLIGLTYQPEPGVYQDYIIREYEGDPPIVQFESTLTQDQLIEQQAISFPFDYEQTIEILLQENNLVKGVSIDGKRYQQIEHYIGDINEVSFSGLAEMVSEIDDYQEEFLKAFYIDIEGQRKILLAYYDQNAKEYTNSWIYNFNPEYFDADLFVAPEVAQQEELVSEFQIPEYIENAELSEGQKAILLCDYLENLQLLDSSWSVDGAKMYIITDKTEKAGIVDIANIVDDANAYHQTEQARKLAAENIEVVAFEDVDELNADQSSVVLAENPIPYIEMYMDRVLGIYSQENKYNADITEIWMQKLLDLSVVSTDSLLADNILYSGNYEVLNSDTQKLFYLHAHEKVAFDIVIQQIMTGELQTNGLTIDPAQFRGAISTTDLTEKLSQIGLAGDYDYLAETYFSLENQGGVSKLVPKYQYEDMVNLLLQEPFVQELKDHEKEQLLTIFAEVLAVNIFMRKIFRVQQNMQLGLTIVGTDNVRPPRYELMLLKQELYANDEVVRPIYAELDRDISSYAYEASHGDFITADFVERILLKMEDDEQYSFTNVSRAALSTDFPIQLL